MKRKFYRRILFFVFVLYNACLTAQTIQFPTFDKYCVSDEERKLYNLIAGYRSDRQLPPIEFSSSLSYVARVHAMDLSLNRPDFGGCNLHSWSDKGRWKACCYAKDENRIACMTQKPKELTGYKYKAYEVVYSSSEIATADDSFSFWKEITLMNDYLLNTGKWTKHWQAVGVGIYAEYACVWFGEGPDASGQVYNCSDTIHQDSSGINDKLMYFIITGNVSSIDQAQGEVRKLISKGFKNALYVPGSTFIRIATNRFKTESEAVRELENVKKIYPSAWILRPNVNK
ncbi:MAG TPA: SPOR domain-containing protein [Lentimicrobium sp.]|nr:SPOR domain-containing protein [Lentimicrobium sp.]